MYYKLTVSIITKLSNVSLAKIETLDKRAYISLIVENDEETLVGGAENKPRLRLYSGRV